MDPLLEFEKLIKEQALAQESSLLDYKARLPVILGNKPKSQTKNHAKTITDVIAFANTARVRGVPAYLVFGIENNRTFVGIEGQSIWEDIPPDWDDITWEEQCDRINRQLTASIVEYIIPPITGMDYRYGKIDGKLLSCLIIPPLPTPRPFEVKKEVKERLKDSSGRNDWAIYLAPGLCWVRNGESNRDVPEEDKKFLKSFHQVPFIHNNQWREYLTQFKNSPETNSFILLTEEGNYLEQVAKDFVLQKKERFLIVEGMPGAGKTTFLNSVLRFFSLIALETLEENIYEHIPSQWIPIQYSLNRFHYSHGDLSHKLATDENALPINRFVHHEWREEPEKLFTDRRIRFLFLLDALDEIVPDKHNNQITTKSIENLLNDFPQCKVIITSRPDFIPDFWRTNYGTVSVASLPESQIELEIKSQLEYADIALEFLYSEPNAYELIQSPLLLRPVIDYWRDLEQRRLEEEILLNNDDPKNGIANEVAIQTNLKLIEDFETDPSDELLFSEKILSIGRFEPEEREIQSEIPTELPELINNHISITASIGDLTYKVFSTLLEHDKNKGLISNYDEIRLEYISSLGELAAKIDGSEQISQQMALRSIARYQNNEYTWEFYTWALNIGILRRLERMVSFRFYLSKLYFAAIHLKELIEDNDIERINSITPSDFWLETLDLFKDLTFFQDSLSNLRKILTRPRWLKNVYKLLDLLRRIMKG